MEYRNLGKTGIKVTPLCLGTMNFGPRTSVVDAIAIIDRFVNSGHNFIDTANFYGQSLNDGKGQGITETILAKAIKGKREKLVIATKLTAPTDWDDPNARGGSRRHIMQAVEDSLRRLRTDYIDLYQIHRPDPATPIDETLRALDDLIRSGKIRYIGTSTFSGWQLVEALWESDRLHLNRIVTEQPRYSLIERRIETDVIPVAQKYGIGIMAYSPLGGGILTGKYKRDEPYPEGSRATDEDWGDWATSFFSEKVYDLVDLLVEMSAEKGCSPSQLALTWVIQQPGVTSAIIGPRTMDHLDDNLDALEVTLSEDDLKRLDEASIPGGALYEIRR